MRIITCHPLLLPIKRLDYGKILSSLGKAREIIARLDEQWLQKETTSLLLEPLMWQESISSLRARHMPAIFRDTLQAHVTGLFPNKRTPLIQQIIAVKQAIALTKHKGKINQQFFCNIHRHVQENSPTSKNSGHIRDRQNWIGPEGCSIEEAYFYPPLAKQIPALLHNLEIFLVRKDFEPLLQIAFAFAQFLIIHPFMDGNGRVARIFIPIHANQKKLTTHPALFLSEYFEATHTDYFQKLFMISDQNAWTDWIDYFLQGVILQMQKTDCRLRHLARLWEKTVQLSDEKTAEHLFRQPVIQRDSPKIQRLVKHKLLTAQGKDYLFFSPLAHAMKYTTHTPNGQKL